MRRRLDTAGIAEAMPALSRVLAVGGLALFAVLLLWVLGGAGGSYRVHAVFEDVRGLIPGGEVRAGSENVGSVKDITLGDDGLPLVTMEIDDDVELRRGAFADIRLASNVGGVNRYVELTEGSGEPLPDGATLGPSQTDQPVDLDEAVSDLDPQTREEVAAVIAGVDASVRGRGDDLGRALRHSGYALTETAELLGQVSQDRLALKTLVAQSSRVVGALAEAPRDVGESAERLAGLLAITAARQDELARSARALAPGLRGARRALDELANGIPNLTELAVASGPAVSELAPTARLIRPAIDALEPLIEEARLLIAATPAQVERFRAVLRAVEPVTARLEPLIDGAGPMLDYMRTWAPEVTSFFTLWADASSNYDAAGNLARLGFNPIQVERHTNEIGPSAGPVPGLQVRPFHRTPGALEGEPWEDYGESFIGGGKPIEELAGD